MVYPMKKYSEPSKDVTATSTPALATMDCLKSQATKCCQSFVRSRRLSTMWRCEFYKTTWAIGGSGLIRVCFVLPRTDWNCVTALSSRLLTASPNRTSSACRTKTHKAGYGWERETKERFTGSILHGK